MEALILMVLTVQHNNTQLQTVMHQTGDYMFFPLTLSSKFCPQSQIHLMVSDNKYLLLVVYY